MREYIAKGLLGTVTPLFALAVSLMEHIKEIIQISGLLAAIAVSIYSILSIREQRKLTREQFRKTTAEASLAEEELCEECRKGYPPAKCPLTVKPKDCPLLKL
jgi:hypothetical protein